MEKAIEVIENKLQEIQKYSHLGETFKARELILLDVLKELKNVKK